MTAKPSFALQYVYSSISIACLLYLLSCTAALVFITVFALTAFTDIYMKMRTTDLDNGINWLLNDSYIHQTRKRCQSYCEFVKLCKMIELGFQFHSNTNIICQFEDQTQESEEIQSISIDIYINFMLIYQILKEIVSISLTIGLIKEHSHYKYHPLQTNKLKMRQILAFNKEIFILLTLVQSIPYAIQIFRANPLQKKINLYIFDYKVKCNLLPCLSKLQSQLKKQSIIESMHQTGISEMESLGSVYNFLAKENQQMDRSFSLLQYQQLYNRFVEPLYIRSAQSLSTQQRHNQSQTQDQIQMHQLQKNNSQADSQINRSNVREKKAFMEKLDALLRLGMIKQKLQQAQKMEKLIQLQYLPSHQQLPP